MIRRVSSTTVRPTSLTVAARLSRAGRRLEDRELRGARLGLGEQFGVGQGDRRVRRERRDEGDVAIGPGPRLVGDRGQRPDDPVVMDEWRDEVARELEDRRRSARSRGWGRSGRPARPGRGPSAGPRRPSPRRGGTTAGGSRRRRSGRPTPRARGGPRRRIRIVVTSARSARFVSSTIVRNSSSRSCDEASRSAMPRTESSRSASSASSDRVAGCDGGRAGAWTVTVAWPPGPSVADGPSSRRNMDGPTLVDAVALARPGRPRTARRSRACEDRAAHALPPVDARTREPGYTPTLRTGGHAR